MGRSELSKKVSLTRELHFMVMNSIVIKRGLNTFNSLRLAGNLAIAKPNLEPLVGLDVVECEYRSNQWCASLPLNGLAHTDLDLSLVRDSNTLQVQLAEHSQMLRFVVNKPKSIRLPKDAKIDSVQAKVIDEQLVICVDLIDEMDGESCRVPIQGL